MTNELKKSMKSMYEKSMIELPRMQPGLEDSPKEGDRKKAAGKSIVHLEADEPVIVLGGDDDP